MTILDKWENGHSVLLNYDAIIAVAESRLTNRGSLTKPNALIIRSLLDAVNHYRSHYEAVQANWNQTLDQLAAKDKELREAEKRGMEKFAQLEIPLCYALDGVSWVRQAGEPPPNVTVYWRTGADTALAMLEAIRAAIKD